MTLEVDNNVFPKIIAAEQGSDPTTPSAGERKLYAKSDGWYDEDDAGTVTGPFGAAVAATFAGARAYNSANIATVSGTIKVLPLDSERYDTDAFHDGTTNTSRLTVPTGKAGKYLITGHVAFAGASGGTQRLIGIRLNGATDIAYQKMTPNSTNSVVASVTTVYDLADADYVELIALQDSGSGLNVTAAGNISPELTISKLG
jgi:hypothetical protein